MMKKSIAYIRNKILNLVKDAEYVHCSESDQQTGAIKNERIYGESKKHQKSGCHSLSSLHYFQNQHRM
jgi:hypothetical protein